MTQERKIIRRFLRHHPWMAAEVDMTEPDDPKLSPLALQKLLRWAVTTGRVGALDDSGLDDEGLYAPLAKFPWRRPRSESVA